MPARALPTSAPIAIMEIATPVLGLAMTNGCGNGTLPKVFSPLYFPCYEKRQMEKRSNNYAFIDSQNLNLGIRELGWSLDLRRFRIYLTEKYGATEAYLFVGYIPTNQSMYDAFKRYGYRIIFKPTIKDGSGKVKGNIDAELVLQTMIEIQKFHKAIIASSDGDFYCLVNYLYSINKLKVVLSPSIERCSSLLIRASRERINFMQDLKGKLAWKRKSTARDETL